MNCIERCLKRTFDFTLALVSLVLFSPVMLVIAILIRREEPDGDVIYTQERVGYKGRPFKLYKFRSMYMDAEKDNAPQLYQEQDPRLTKIGAFIRAHHLDEFPRLWNVIKGDMSFVGPRPERQYFISAVRHDYERLYALRPGLFSFATLYNGYTDTLEKMLRRLDLDIKYLENYSLWTDIKIIFLTSQSIIFGKKF